MNIRPSNLLQGDVLERLPVATFLDYGPSVEAGGKYPGPYEKAIAGGAHRVIAPGEKKSSQKRHHRRHQNQNPLLRCVGSHEFSQPREKAHR